MCDTAGQITGSDETVGETRALGTELRGKTITWATEDLRYGLDGRIWAELIPLSIAFPGRLDTRI